MLYVMLVKLLTAINVQLSSKQTVKPRLSFPKGKNYEFQTPSLYLDQQFLTIPKRAFHNFIP